MVNRLLDQKVQRGNNTDPAKTLNEWQPAEAQLTVDGLNAFAERQRQRMREAEEKRKALAKETRPIELKARRK